jgi:DNA-binding transcriptional LysR family regulator
MMDFVISPDDCRILYAIHHSSSLREAAKQLKCDPSGLIRKVHRIAQDYDLLRKINGKWSLSTEGVELLSWMSQSIKAQRDIFKSPSYLKIAAYGWLMEEAIIPELKNLQNKLSDISKIQLHESLDLERSIKSAEVDFAIACHPPEDPDISHKRILIEDWIVIIPKGWNRLFKGKSNSEVFSLLSNKPYVKHISLNQNNLLKDISFDSNITLEFNKLNQVKLAVQNGLGWAFVPRLSARQPIMSKEVTEINIGSIMNNHFCLWHLRSRNDLKSTEKILMKWVSKAFNF